MRNFHNIQETTIMEDMGINIPSIYATLEDEKVKHQSHMIQVEGKIINQPIYILIDSGEIHSYIDPKVVDIFHLMKSKLETSWLVHLATKTKRMFNGTFIGFPMSEWSKYKC
jgi:hypothetical protein